MLIVLDYVFGGIQTLRLSIRKTVECFKWGLMNHPSSNMGDSGAQGDLNCGGQGQEVSEKKMLVCGLEMGLVIFC